jgi:hypothetical protein
VIPLISALKINVAFFLILSILIATLILPPDREISLANFASSHLIGFAQVKLDGTENGIKSAIQARLNDFWIKQKDTLNDYLRPLLYLIQTSQKNAISKVLPYYGAVLFYATNYSEKPLVIYVVNSRVNQYLLKFLFLPALSLSSDYLKKDFQVVSQLEINKKKYQIYRFNRYLLMFYHNLCLISDTLVAFNYALTDTNRVLPPNLGGIKSLFDSRSDLTFTLDNRDKTYRLAQKLIEARKLPFDSEIEIELYQTIMQKLKTFSDSIITTEINADLVNNDMIKGSWLIQMHSGNSAQKFTLVVDGLHRLISQELASRDLLYRVERKIIKNQIVSEFEITGLSQLFQKN